jgi:hypothetical protein
MITMDMLGKVRRMKMRDKLTISEIAKRTDLARNTVKDSPKNFHRRMGALFPTQNRLFDN